MDERLLTIAQLVDRAWQETRIVQRQGPALRDWTGIEQAVAAVTRSCRSGLAEARDAGLLYSKV